MPIQTEKFIIDHVRRGRPIVSQEIRADRGQDTSRGTIVSMAVICRSCANSWTSAGTGDGRFQMGLTDVTIQCPKCKSSETILLPTLG